MHIRNLLWWDGVQAAVPTISDAELSAPGIARLTGKTATGQPYVAAIKAGHNEENHNQNDIGSFVLHVDGENLLTDPGRGLYNRFYFGPQRYENIFANSYGHSVPRIGGQLQAPGRQYRGELISVSTESGNKSATVEFAGAYSVEGLSHATRTLALERRRRGLHYRRIRVQRTPRPVEEAFVTWGEVEVHGPTATVRGEAHVADDHRGAGGCALRGGVAGRSVSCEPTRGCPEAPDICRTGGRAVAGAGEDGGDMRSAGAAKRRESNVRRDRLIC